MLAPRNHLILTVISVIAAVLVLTNVLLFKSNQTLNAEVTNRGQYIQQSVQLEPLYQQIIKALAELAVNNNDAQLRDLLNAQGITFSQNSPAAVPAPNQ